MSASLDLDDLVRRSKEETVTAGELSSVAERLTAGAEPEELYRLLYVLARSNARQYESLVAGFLDDSSDPEVARLALQTLCTFWGLTDRYRDRVLAFLRGVDWDSFGVVRQVAITAAGEYLKDNDDCELISALLAVTESGDTAVERRIAVEAIARALGEPLGATINANKGERSWQDWAGDILSRGRQRQSAACQ